MLNVRVIINPTTTTILKPKISVVRPSKRTTTIVTMSASNYENNPPSSSSSAAGRVKRAVLRQEERTKLNPNSDGDFYAYPRFVTHVDDGFISTLTELYRERVRAGFEVLDLMSSWVSHLPAEVTYKRVVGHGLNAEELSKNPRLDSFFVKDLNVDQRLDFQSSSFDAVLCTVSVQYLQQPEKVFAEVFRVLKPGGIFIVSFSNRMFYEKAIAAWRDGTEYSRVQLVKQYFQSVEGFTEPEVIKKSPATNVSGGRGENMPFNWTMGLLGLVPASDPFYAVVSYRNFKPVY